ncbi:hypothetical protein TNCV_1012641 [Trichonephila clavipes]|uniref:Uncharacterized protein n=1 Tax=Trichonephila clavipes TaxID=2585209 RepID=A0A8X7B9H4_TRICX|nr:hypothetical protein TNCV_1012641 [Trichonephila clavipes]
MAKMESELLRNSINYRILPSKEGENEMNDKKEDGKIGKHFQGILEERHRKDSKLYGFSSLVLFIENRLRGIAVRIRDLT